MSEKQREHKDSVGNQDEVFNVLKTASNLSDEIVPITEEIKKAVYKSVIEKTLDVASKLVYKAGQQKDERESTEQAFSYLIAISSKTLDALEMGGKEEMLNLVMILKTYDSFNRSLPEVLEQGKPVK